MQFRDLYSIMPRLSAKHDVYYPPPFLFRKKEGGLVLSNECLSVFRYALFQCDWIRDAEQNLPNGSCNE